MKLLAFESSFDDMAICLYVDNVIYHKTSRASNSSWGGGVPEVNARHHTALVNQLLMQILDESKIKLNDIDCFAGTVGPGLLPCLQIGYNMAKLLAMNLKKTFIPVHHMEGHLFTCVQKTPTIVLLISGGHTMIVLVEKYFNYHVICDTKDDAVGEVFDKIARKLGLGFPGGAKLEHLAKQSDCTIKLPVPIPKELAFSFSGIKTKLLNLINQNTHNNKYTLADLAAITQNTLTHILIHKTQLALSYIQEKYELFDLSIGLSGGVACNQHIRTSFQTVFKQQCVFAPADLCGDNAIMIAHSALLHTKHQTSMVNNYNIDLFPRMSLENWSKLIILKN